MNNNLFETSERQRARQIQAATYQIAQAANSTERLQDLYQSIHRVLATLMPVNNFFIALYHAQEDQISFPYFVDEVDLPPPPQKVGKNLTAFVLRTGKSLLASPEIFEMLVKQGEVEEMGSPSIDWLGVPLTARGKTIGVLAVQSYTQGIRFGPLEKDILEFVSYQVGMAIERKRSEETIRINEARYRAIIEDQTDMICRFLPDTTLTYVNQAMCNLYGMFPDQLLGQSFLFLVPTEAQERSRIFIHNLTPEKPFNVIEDSRTTPAGKTRWIQWVNRAIFDELGRPVEIQSVGRDISEQKQRQREMEAIVNLSTALRVARTRSEMAPVVLDQIAHILTLEGAVLGILDPMSNRIRLEAGLGIWQQTAGKSLPLNASTTEQVIFSGRQFHSNSIQQASNPTGLTLPEGVSAVACTSLIAQENNIGVIWVVRRTRLNTNDLQMLTTIADIAASAIRRASLHEQTQQSLQRLTALRAIDMAISTSTDLNATLSILNEQIIKQLKVGAVCIWLLDPATRMLEYAASEGLRLKDSGKSLRLGESHAGLVAQDRRMDFVTNLDQIRDDLTEGLSRIGQPFKTYIGLPLIAKNQVKGVLELFHQESIQPDHEWLNDLQAMAAQTAIAIDNADLLAKLQDSNLALKEANEATIEGWSQALELRDHETQGHSKRVVDLTLSLVRHMGMDEDEVEHIRLGVLLHDIGKMGIPDEILQKPGPLNEEEWKIMRRHPEYAYQILSPIPYLKRAREIPYCHHERWDGSGYPRGLLGEEIPFSARIFASVDVWEALTSDRCYRPAWAEDEVIYHLASQSGKHFDPRIVESFLNYIRQKPA